MDGSYLDFVEVAEAYQAPVHSHCDRYEDEFLREDVLSPGPALHTAVRLLKIACSVYAVKKG